MIHGRPDQASMMLVCGRLFMLGFFSSRLIIFWAVELHRICDLWSVISGLEFHYHTRNIMMPKQHTTFIYENLNARRRVYRLSAAMHGCCVLPAATRIYQAASSKKELSETEFLLLLDFLRSIRSDDVTIAWFGLVFFISLYFGDSTLLARWFHPAWNWLCFRVSVQLRQWVDNQCPSRVHSDTIWKSIIAGQTREKTWKLIIFYSLLFSSTLFPLTADKFTTDFSQWKDTRISILPIGFSRRYCKNSFRTMARGWVSLLFYISSCIKARTYQSELKTEDFFVPFSNIHAYFNFKFLSTFSHTQHPYVTAAAVHVHDFVLGNVTTLRQQPCRLGQWVGW